MREVAIPAGERLIDAERAIEQAFAERGLDKERLRQLLAEAEEARAELPFVHLASHLDILEILDDDQVARDNELRGYTTDQADPCRQRARGPRP